jgi:hypothetical protein
MLIVASAVLFAVVGARFSAPHDRESGERFSYQPPPGFIETKSGADQEPEERQWEHAQTNTMALAAHVHLAMSKKSGTVEAADLARISEGMPNMLLPSGVTWKETRRETRTRSDGARVGLIEGECSKASVDIGFGVSALPVRYRRLMLVFPTDNGTGLVTAAYAEADVATFQPAFEATLATARGVAVRVPPAPPWLYAAWGIAGLLVGYFVSAMFGRGARSRSREPSEPRAES